MGSVDEILALNSTEKFYVERKEYCTNHMTHGIISLHRLGAPPERIEQFVDCYQRKLTLKDQSGDTAATEEDISDLLGKRKYYYAILNHYSKLLEDTGDLDKFIRQELYHLRFGMGCSVIHGLIQMGHGFSERNSRSVVEGIAYIHHSYEPLKVPDGLWNRPFGSGDMNMLDVVDRVTKDGDLKQIMLDESSSEYWINRNVGAFRSKVGAVLAKAGDKLMTYVHMLRYDPPIRRMSDVLILGRWLVDAALTIYVTSERRNDFFLLHGVTGAWSLLQLLPCFEKPDEALEFIKVYLCILLAFYLGDGSPPLTLEEKHPNLDNEYFWKDRIEETMKLARNVHIYKVVQVAYDMFKDASNDHQRSLCMAAAETALNYDLARIDPHPDYQTL